MSNALYRVTDHCKDKSLIGKTGPICIAECDFPHSIVIQIDGKKCCFGPWEIEPFKADDLQSSIAETD